MEGRGGGSLWVPVYIRNCGDNWRGPWAVALQGVFLLKTRTAGTQECASVIFFSSRYTTQGQETVQCTETHFKWAISTFTFTFWLRSACGYLRGSSGSVRTCRSLALGRKVKASSLSEFCVATSQTAAVPDGAALKISDINLP